MSATFESGFQTTLSQRLRSSGTDTSIILAAAPDTVTAGVVKIGEGNNVEWVRFTGITGTTITGCKRGYDKDASTTTAVTATNKKDNAVGAPVKLVAHSYDLNQKANLDDDNAHTAGKTTFTSTTEAQFQNQSLTTTERLALTGVTNGTVVYDETLGVHYQYIAGAWATYATGAVTNATLTAGGKVALMTAAEVAAGTDTEPTSSSPGIAPPSTIATSVQNSVWDYIADAGANDTYVITLVPAIAAYVDGQVFYFQANTANTGACTLNVNGKGAKTIKKFDDQDLENGDIEAKGKVQVIYDSTDDTFKMLSPVATQMSTANSATLTDASDADALHTHPTYTLTPAILTLSYDVATASGTSVIAHGLSKTPVLVKVEAIYSSDIYSIGTSAGAVHKCIYSPNTANGSVPTISTTKSIIIFIDNANNDDRQEGTITVDATNITVNWTKTAAPTGTAKLIFTVFA